MLRSIQKTWSKSTVIPKALFRTSGVSTSESMNQMNRATSKRSKQRYKKIIYPRDPEVVLRDHLSQRNEAQSLRRDLSDGLKYFGQRLLSVNMSVRSHTFTGNGEPKVLPL